MSREAKTLSKERADNLRKQVYSSAPLDQYPKKKQLSIRFAAFLSYLLVYLIGCTMRWQMFRGNDRRGNIASDQPLIYVFWHNRILPATWFFRNLGIVVMTSQSYDGEIIARMIQLFGYGASRGSTTKGGSKSLREMASCLQAGFDVAFTIDGPKGPIYQAKPGAIQLAKLTGCPILPVCQTPMNYWELKSWDRFRIPKFFSRGLIAYAKPIYVSRDSDEQEVLAKQNELQSVLEWLHQESEEWIKTSGQVVERECPKF
ncbi:MAG: lysophospholipid acyltransferase family protein [Acidobacteria bacterium]|nr:lysophospholipid acyltransferase family protein [Acidobacteriota bacterium]